MTTIDALELRDFDPQDQEPVRSLILDGLAEHWGEVDGSLNRDLDDIAIAHRGGRTVVGSLDGRIVATGTALRRPVDTTELVRMAVASDWRRCGIGRVLLDELVSTAASWDHRRVILETSSAWTGTVAFYVSYGFAITHTTVGDFGEDTWFELRL